MLVLDHFKSGSKHTEAGPWQLINESPMDAEIVFQKSTEDFDAVLESEQSGKKRII